MKKTYKSIELELIALNLNDVIVTSNDIGEDDGENEGEWV